MDRKSILLTITFAGIIFVGVIVYNIFDDRIAGNPHDKKSNLQTRTGETGQTAELYAFPIAQAKKETEPVDNNPGEGPPNKSSDPEQPREEEDISDRIRRARKLRQEPSKKNIALLKKFIGSENRTLVLSALNSLAFIGKGTEFEDEILTLLQDKAKDPDFSQRGQALIIASLMAEDERVLPIINEFIAREDNTESYIRYAVAALAAVGNPACVDSLEKILDRACSPEIHQRAFHTLGKINDAQSTAILEKHLLSGTEQNQAYSAWALAMNNTPGHNEILYQALAAKQLGQETIGVLSRSSAGARILGDLLVEDTFEIADKISTLETLEKSLLLSTGSVRSNIIENVEPLLDSDNYEIQLHALKIVGSGFGDEETLDLISPKLSSPDTRVRKTAVDAYLPYLTESNYKPLLHLIWDEDEAVRRKAFSSAFAYIDDSDRPLLEKALGHQDEFIRNQVFQALN
ncbi:MAG: HEAT repeat domain-containing protein [Desulfobacteraceae bacterium]|nr:HEAT repeat domain-containing protein [Desulfobacteraceae bacterium]